MSDLLSYLPAHDLTFFAETPVVFHCHHYNLFLDQSIDDAMGAEKGVDLRMRAAREAFRQLFSELIKKTGASTPEERLALASQVFAGMGHGTLQIEGSRWGGQATGNFLHYGFAWKDKYSQKLKRRHPADAVAAGAAAAALEVAYDLTPLSVEGKETECIALGDSACSFQLRSTKPEPLRKSVGKEDAKNVVKRAFTGIHEDDIVDRANKLRAFLETVKSDERGLIQGFGVFVTMHLSAYYNRISYDALYELQKQHPRSFGAMEALLREAGHVCGFNTFGGILMSPEWEGLFGPLSGDPLEVLIGCCAIGRALGFGHWCIEDFEPEKYFVLRTPSSYESNYHATRYPQAETGRCYLLQGGTLAQMQLAHRVKWKEKPDLTVEYYGELFRKGVPWKVQETKCISKGDDCCELVVDLK
ncbi:MAG TPA: hypothetical protein DCE42_27925 [Myxococcales bacterium]|nr:hypothetical protein [Deltaproteobacteria bacterium]MBU50370.1 hypothetical protein [Deltaproteobacteria bacterium]HAA58623.1 hypothetical protein [Myxococcales bacterium]|tara:strand:- start:1571 stop:2818 length:1248 start_codon:yes stop_codon:yes gene_type:complete